MQSLAELVERHWGLGHVRLGPVLQRSPTRTVVPIQADRGSFVAKAYDDDWALGLVRPSAAEIDQRLGIFDFLAGSGFGHAPALLRTQDGARFVRANGSTVVILDRIEGSSPPATPATWAELGRIAAHLNGLTSYPVDYAIAIAGTIAELTRNAERYPFRQDMLRLVSSLGVLAGEPTCPIHGEINLANSVMSPDGTIFLLDWDQAGTGPWALEPGYPLITTFLSEDLVFDAASATEFYGSWNEKQRITPERQDVIFTAAILHALRYLEFGDPARRWARIRYAQAQRDELLAALDTPDFRPAPEADR